MADALKDQTRKELPDLHQQAFLIKNRKRLQHDGGRAWIRDGQLHEAVRGANYHIERGVPLSERLKNTGREVLERRAGSLISKTNSHRKL
ncbi:MAG: hypothetical protein R6U28_02515 [Cyclonatronaceae bacterium]